MHAAGLLVDGAAAYARTHSGGLHVYFTGSDQRNGHLPRHHLDFRSAGGYILTPPSQIDGRPYQTIRTPGGQAGLNWQAVIRTLDPDRQHHRPQPHSSNSPASIGNRNSQSSHSSGRSR